MKILLINPNFRDLLGRFEKYLTTPFTIPLGLAYLASNLEKYNYEVKVLDAHVENLKISEIVKITERFKPKIVGLSAHSSAGHCARLAEEIKGIKPEIITVIGGVVPSLLPEETLRLYNCFDFLISGEGEFAFLNLIRAIAGHVDLASISGLGYRQEKGGLVYNPRNEFIEDLDSLPFPARHLFPNRLYRFWPRLPANVETLITASRGCSSGNCDFCSIGKIFGKKVRQRDPDKVVDEMEECLDKYSIKNFNFIDSTFTHDRNFVCRITEAIKRRKLHKKIKWWCSSRVDCIDEELLIEMKNSGCAAISYGIEFGSQEMLDYFNKKLKLEDIEKAISLTKKLGIWTTGCIMINQYTTNHTVIKQTSDFLLKTKPDFLRISPLIVIPGTKLHSLLQTQGCFRNSDYLSCLEGRFIESRYINDKELYRIKRNLYLSYYLKSGSIISWVRNLLRLK